MNHKLLGRVLSFGMLAILAGWGAGVYKRFLVQKGRDAYMEKAGARWDHYFAHPHSIPFYILEWLIILGALLAVYELLAFVIFRILTTITRRSEQNQTPS